MTTPISSRISASLISLLVIGLLVSAGCGSDDEGPSGSPDSIVSQPDGGPDSTLPSPDQGRPPREDASGPSPEELVGKPCTSDADCVLPELGCLPPPMQRCSLTCTPQEGCANAACGPEGLCPLCGDGICDAGEQANAGACPLDCEAVEVKKVPLTLQNPTSGATLAGTLYLPLDASAATTYPAVALVPGGTGDGSSFEKMGITTALVQAGFIALTFDLDGRGASEGTEDQCGHIHQDAIHAFLSELAGRPEVQADRIGMMSNSFGITCASGALARYADTTPVKFLVDNEGPANRNDTGHCDASDTGHITGVACDDEAFWSEREASEHIKQVAVPYLRVQYERDHVQPDNNHAILMINNATHQDHGGNGHSPWTLVNTEALNTPNSVYTEASPPAWLPNNSGPTKTELLQQMFDAFAPAS